MRSEFLCVMIALLLLFSRSIPADNLYMELVQRADISEKGVAEARKQLEEHKDIELQDKLSVPPFHNRVDNLPAARRPFCQNCHLALPHRSNERSRSFLNMHSRYIACETCHLKPEGLKLDYRWLDYDKASAGRLIKIARSARESGEPPGSIVPGPGTMIAPFYHEVPALLFKDHPYASEVTQQWKRQSTDQKARLKAALHASIDKEGRPCQNCHTDKQNLLDLESLGADEEQRHAISNNVIARFFTRYKNDDERLRLNELLE